MLPSAVGVLAVELAQLLGAESMHHVWGPALRVVSVLFEHVRVDDAAVLATPGLQATLLEVLAAVVRLRNRGVPGAEVTLASSVRCVGVEYVYDAVVAMQPALFETPWSDECLWLLTLLQRNAQQGRIAWWREVMQPLAQKIEAIVAKPEQFALPPNIARHALVQRLQEAALVCWELLGAMCQGPVDAETQWAPLAKFVADLLVPKHALGVPTIPTASRLLMHAFRAGNKAAAQDSPALAALASTAPKFLPRLFNCVPVVDQSQVELLSHAILECSKMSPRDQVVQLFDEVLRRLLRGTIDGNMLEARSMTLICLSLVHAVPSENVVKLYKSVCVNLKKEEAALQKPSYRIVGAIFARDDAPVDAVEAVGMLVSVGDQCSAGARKARLKAVANVVTKLRGPAIASVSPLMMEAMIATKDAAIRTRTLAYHVVSTIASQCLKHGEQAVSLSNLVEVMVAGLASSTSHAQSAVAEVLAKFMHEFASSLTQETASQLAATGVILLTHTKKEVVRSAVHMCRAATRALGADVLMTHASDMIRAVLGLPKALAQVLRLEVRAIIDRLVRKLGDGMVEPLFPAEHKPLLHAVIKQRRRALRRRAEQRSGRAQRARRGAAASKSSDDDSEADRSHARATRALSDSSSDDDDDDLSDASSDAEGGRDRLDLLARDSDLGVRRRREHTRGENEAVPRSRDGRLVFNESDSDDAGDRRRRGAHGSTAAAAGASKRTSSRADAAADDDDSDSESDVDLEKLLKNDAPQNRRDRKESGVQREKKGAGASSGMAGESYRSKDAHTGGDVRRKGQKFEPFAYIPLDPKYLNKRRTNQAAAPFKSIATAAQRGAAKGAKEHARNKRVHRS